MVVTFPSLSDKQSLSPEAIVVLSIIGLILIIKILGTIVHLTPWGSYCELSNDERERLREEAASESEWLQQDKKPWARVAYCFSIPRCWHWVFTQKDNHVDPEIRFTNGLLFFSVLGFILHTSWMMSIEYGT